MIFIPCYEPSKYIKTEILNPIQLNCKNAQIQIENMYHDDEGDNISFLNPQYGDLTAQYWAWKNCEADYYGFLNRGRYLNFSDTIYEENIDGSISEDYLDDTSIKKYGIYDEQIHKQIADNDIVIAKSKDKVTVLDPVLSVYDQYRNNPFLHIEDMDRLLNIIDTEFPNYSTAAHEYIEGCFGSSCNIFIMRRNVYFEYCEWLFAVLEKFCLLTDMSRYSTEALRTPEHLAERMLGIYLLYKKNISPDLKIKELQCVVYTHTDPEQTLSPAFDENVIPIAFAANDAFVPMFAACFQSFLDTASTSNNYDVILMHTNISKVNQKRLLKMSYGVNNVSLRFYNVGSMVHSYSLKANAHISVETYYRFLIQEIFGCYGKVLYLDCDTIIKRDVADLFNTDMTGFMIGAVHDIDFLGQIGGANKDTINYVKKDLPLKQPYDYFQAGVLLINEEEMRKAYSLDEWLTFAMHPYKYNDQDVLNLYCEGRVKFIDMAWNMITDCDHTRRKYVASHAPDEYQRVYDKAYDNPYIIHYAGHMKPWHKPTEDYADEFWKSLRKTDFYEELIYRMMIESSRSDARMMVESEGGRIRSDVGVMIEESINELRSHTLYGKRLALHNRIFPIGTERRRFLDNIYVKLMCSKRNRG